MGDEQYREHPSISLRILFAAGIYLLFWGGYEAANRMIPLTACHDLSLALDRAWPLVPEFVFAFYLTYALMLMPALLIRSRRLFYRAALAFAVLILISSLLFFLVPVYVPRPETIPETFAGHLLMNIYRMDRPVCGFPSLHASTPLLASLVILRERKTMGYFFLAFALLTSLATLFIKQHVIADIAGGMLMAVIVYGLFIRDGLGKIMRSMAAARLLLANMRTLPPGGKGKPFTETRHSTSQGTEYDLYEPTAAVRNTVIVVQGIITLGERDQRMINFSRALAGSGVRAAAIHLPALSECRFAVSDLTAIVDLAQTLHTRYQQPIGIIAFSFGSGMALAASSHPRAAGILDPLLLFGPYYSMSELWDSIEKSFSAAPQTEQEWDDYIWLRMLVAFRDRDRLNFAPDKAAELADILGRWCFEPSAERKRRFYEQEIKPREPLDTNRKSLDQKVLDSLSPKGKLGAVSGRVLILHDANDLLIPPEHSRRIFAELAGEKNIRGHRLLVTPLLSHVFANFTWGIFDLFPLLGIVGELFLRPYRRKTHAKGAET